MTSSLKYDRRLLAIIPARSGSKGLKDKNIRLLNKKPLIAYSIEAAIESGIFDTVHVSTDSQEYADIATNYGADEPFLRGEMNAGDSSSSWDAVREVLYKYKSIGKEFDAIILLQPTSPLRSPEDIRTAYKLFIDMKATSLTSVTEVDHPVQWCFKLTDGCSMNDYVKSPFKYCCRQELEKYYRENGAIYIVGAENICNPSFDFYNDECVAYVMDRERSLDIDTLQDFVFAETVAKMNTKERE